MGGLEPGMHEGGPDWRATSKIEPCGLDIDGTCGKPPAGDSGSSGDAGERLFEGQGGLEHDLHKGGAVNFC